MYYYKASLFVVKKKKMLASFIIIDDNIIRIFYIKLNFKNGYMFRDIDIHLVLEIKF